MKEYTLSETQSIVQEELTSGLEAVLRRGAQQMRSLMLEWAVAQYIEKYQQLLDEKGHRLVVRHGYHPPREVTTGIGKIALRQPRVQDRREGQRFTRAILPKYARRWPSIDTLIPTLYLKGVSTSSFPEALEALLGKNAPGLSAANIRRLKSIWEDEYSQWRQRDLTGKHYVYVWADAVYFKVRLSAQRPCVLVLVGATADGRKEVIAIEDGQRESHRSWQGLLQGLKARGLTQAPALAIGDGALSFWTALEEEFPATKHQRCWVHKTANVLDKRPKSLQPDAKKDVFSPDARLSTGRLWAVYQPVSSQVSQGLRVFREGPGRAVYLLRFSRPTLATSAFDQSD